jgi:Ca2+-binding EF-hand superfamily protein
MRFAAGLAIALGSVAPVDAQRAAMRFQGMDRNGDGVITRQEWRGTDRSFERHDWNGDGRLSGDEVRVGALRRPNGDPNGEFDYADREYVFEDWTERGFRSLDHNRDGRITRDEWHFDREGFRYTDHNGDGVISHAEFFALTGEDDDRDDRLANLDHNGDGRVSAAEWHGTPARFDALDIDEDGFLDRTEILGRDAPADLFTSVDFDRNQAITLDEWHWSTASFDRRDVNRDGRLTRQEFDGSAAAPQARSGAYEAGYERGLSEGRQAGRDERLANRAWDLEGQTELQSADSGYQASVGPREQYQSGYRAGFRRGYREGWNQAK